MKIFSFQPFLRPSFQSFFQRSDIFSFFSQIVFFLLVFFVGFTLADRGGIHLVSYFLVGFGLFPFLIFWIFFRSRVFIRCHIFLLIFVLSMWLSYFLSPIHGEGFRELVIFTSGALFCIFISQLSFSKKWMYSFFHAIVFLGWIEILYAFYIYLFGPFNRLSGTFREFQYAYSFFPNALANFLLILIPVVLFLFWQSASKLREFFFAVTAAFYFAALFLTYSRSALLVLAIVFSIFFLFMGFSGAFRIRKFRMKFFKIFIMVLLGVFVTVQVNNFRERSFDVNFFRDKALLSASEKTASVDERFEFWNGSLKLILEKPFFGHGPYSFLFVYPRFQQTLLAISDHPHNLFLKIAVENGLITLSFFFIFLFFVFWKMARSFSTLSSETKPFVFVLFFSLLSGLLHNFLDYNFNFVSIFFLWWIFLGFLIHFLPARTKISSKMSRNFMATIIAIVFVFFIFLLHEMYYGYFFQQGRLAYAKKHFTASVILYEAAKPLWLERSLPFDTAAAYEKRFYFTKNTDDLVKAQSFLQSAMTENPSHALYYFKFAEFGLAHDFISADDAEKYFRRALELDPLNNFAYYFHFLRFLAENNIELFYQWIPRTESLLEAYREKIRNNEHLTVLTDNPRYAYQIYLLFAKYASTEARRDLYLQRANDIVRSWQNKTMEMSLMYEVKRTWYPEKGLL
ncbi:O-antigen ligase family protein [Candidatus Peregrinibacteria bacterium]|nr:O-antigen ligase family protein [Candidatus Peregrinibacteria bacterium]